MANVYRIKVKKPRAKLSYRGARRNALRALRKQRRNSRRELAK